jgi:hypothetical protein
MNPQTGVYLRGIEHLSPGERYRLWRAAQICNQVAAEVGVKIEGVEEVAACVEYVHGNVEETELWHAARAELNKRR